MINQAGENGYARPPLPAIITAPPHLNLIVHKGSDHSLKLFWSSYFLGRGQHAASFSAAAPRLRYVPHTPMSSANGRRRPGHT